MHRFIITGPMRTGSMLVKQMLLPHSTGEIFAHKLFTDKNKELADKRFDDPIPYLDFHLSEVGHDICGAKVMYPQVPDHTLKTLIQEPDIKKILIYRENITEMCLSGMYAHMTQRWAKQKNEKKIWLPDKPKDIDIDATKDRGIKVAQKVKWVKDNVDDNHIVVRYEDIINDDGKINIQTVNKVRQFVSLRPHKSWEPQLLKQSSPELYKKWFTNYDEAVSEMGVKFGVPFSRENKPTIWDEI